MMTETSSRHEETWLALPWLANGRLAGAARLQAEAHVRECSACAQELAAQRALCALLSAPEQVTHAPAPALRKLLERIDAEAAPRPRLSGRVHRARAVVAATWRPPGAAWAATFLCALAMGLLVAVSYRWSQPLYATYTAAHPPAAVLHVAFERSLPVGDMEEILRTAGARVVEGPDAQGILGVLPRQGADAQALRTLAARLHAESRVRWVEPVPGTEPGAAAELPPQDR